MTSEEKITGMKWASGYEEAVTRNILMWTKPILIHGPKGEQVTRNLYMLCVYQVMQKRSTDF